MSADLLYGEVEEQLRSSVRSLLAARAGWREVLARTESESPYDVELWRALTQIGCGALPVPESMGGAGASWREVAVVAEELGRSAAAVPFLTSAVLATAVLLAAGDETGLRALADASATAALVVPFSTHGGTGLDAVVEEVDGRLQGQVRSVAGALTADLLLVPVRAQDGVALHAVDSATARVTGRTSLDMTRQLADVDLAGASGRVLASGAAAEEALQAALTAGAAILASEQLGIAEACLELTVDYLKSRYQFGRPLGSFQGLKHRLADLWVEITQARAVARYAADCLARADADLPVAVAVAAAHCSDVAVHAAEECVQMHGGLGFTWEHPAHLYLKRAKSAQIALGTPDRHRAVLAGLVDLPA